MGKRKRDIHVRYLPQKPAIGVMLLCSQCGGEYSAHREDYFMRLPGDVMACCGQSMSLVVREACTYTDVSI